MRILANPVLWRAAIVLVSATFAFFLGLLSVRMLKKTIAEESDVSDQSSPPLEDSPLALYNTVIQELKHQKEELQMQSQAEQNRARTSESLSQAVLLNLSSGVLVFGGNGLVKSTNPAAKTILGFGSATGMSVEDIFRGSLLRASERADSENSKGQDLERASVAGEVRTALRDRGARRQVQAEYETPGDEKRFLEITIFPVFAAETSLLGVACLINDLSELENLRQETVKGEISGEMAQRLQTSLATIAGYARQLSNHRESGPAAQLAQDIAHEASQLDNDIARFLGTKKAATSAMRAGAN